MSRTRTGLALCGAGVAAATLAVSGSPSPVGAASARPLFKAPFVCGTQWGASTYSGHGKAIDFNLMKGADTDFGKPVLASAPGTARRGYDSGHGNFVVVDHGRGWSTLYAHLNRVTIKNPIRVGEKIGTVGRSGNVTGAHLHYQQRYRGKGVLPLRFNGRTVRYAQSTPGVRLRSTNCATSPRGWAGVASRPGRLIAVHGRMADPDAGTRALTYDVYLYARPGTRGAVRVHVGTTRADGTYAASVRSARTGRVPVYVLGRNVATTMGSARVVAARTVTVTA